MAGSELLSFQEIIHLLERFWADKGCLIGRSYPSEVGAGTFNPLTFLRVLGPEPWRVAYAEPARRPQDGRYAQNPNRVQQHFQFQVILKPSPKEIQSIYLDSLKNINIDIERHDVRFVEDDWDSPTLGAWGLGWQVWLDGLEITQFTYFQQSGGIELEVTPVELTYGLDRIAMHIQKKGSIFDIIWTEGVTWGEIYSLFEEEYSHFNYEYADISFLREQFDFLEKEANNLLERKLLYPAYDDCLKMSHIFNLLDARGALSVQERTGLIQRVRDIAKASAELYIEKRKELNWPLLNK